MADVVLTLADPAVGLVLGGCGAVVTVRRRHSLVGPLMLLGCGCWFIGSLWSAAVFLHRGPLVHLHISYPTGRTRRLLAIVTVVSTYLVSIVEAVAADPWVTLAMAALVAFTAADIYARTSGSARKAGGPALGAALTFASVLALSATNQLLLWQNDRLVLLLYDLAICVVAFVLAADLLRGRWTEATVADFVTQLGARPDASTLSRAVQRALGDPTATIGFWLPQEDRFVDDGGRPFAPLVDLGDRSVIEITDQGQRAAIVVFDPAASHSQQLITDVTAAMRIALGNTRLQARVKANVIELARARRRLVEAADAQRRHLEAELADGPLSRLSQVTRLLQQAEAQVNPDMRIQLRAAQAEVEAARAELRDLAEGIRPAALESGGLAAALPLLIRRAQPLLVHLDVTPTRLAAPIEGAVYFVCAEALANMVKHADAHQGSVEVALEDGSAVTRIIDDGRGGADARGPGLRGLSDRVEALDGTLTVSDRVSGGTVLEARIPVKAPA